MDPSARAGVLPITNTSGSFTQPPPGGLVTVSLNTSTWMNAGQEVFIQSGGSYLVNSVPDGTSASLRNPGYAGNTVAGTSIASGVNVYQIGSRWNTGVADPDNALTPTVNLGIVQAKDLPRSGLVINSSSGSGGVVTGVFYGIQPITDSVVNSITLAPGYEGDSLVAGTTLSAGASYNFGFTSIRLTSGTAIVWRGA
jgi:hypothetical protein